MKKRKPDKVSDSTDVPVVRRRSEEGHLRAAMENVFRLTHGREMTADERRVFGLTREDDGSVRGRRSSHNQNNRNGL